MKKALIVLFTLCLALSGVTVLAEESKSEAPEPVFMDDFTVDTIDGSTFTLYEALKDHELVLINLWASWCGPCVKEFPYLQEAWEKNADKVAVIALSVEPKDTDEVLSDFAKECGVNFPIGNVGNTGLDSFADQGTPTSVIVGSDGKIMAVEVGSLSSAEEFEELFNGYFGENYNPEERTYTVYVEDKDYKPVADVTIGFCTDTACKYGTTDEDGKVVFKGEPVKYHIQFIDVPDGFSDTMKEEVYTEPYDQTIFLSLSEAE